MVYWDLHRVWTTHSLGGDCQVIRSLGAFFWVFLAGAVGVQEVSNRGANPETDPVRLGLFLAQLQKAASSEEPATLVSLVQFPVQVGASGDMISKARFLEDYQKILNDRAKRVLASQKVETLFRDERGIAIGSGEIWFNYLSGVDEFRVTMFNVSKYAGLGIMSMQETEQIDGLFLQFQRALGKNDRQGVLSVLAYPIRVNNDNRSRTLRSNADLLRNYDWVFTPKVKKAILTQIPSQFLVNSDGIMVGTGQVWFTPKHAGRALRLHITTINE